MPFQGDNFVRTQNFTRDRDLGPPENTISAPKVDDELTGIASALTIVKTAISTILGGADPTRNTLKTLYDAVAPRAWFPTLSAGLASAYLRVNAAGTAFESRTPAQARDDIGAVSKDTPVVTTTLQIRQRDPRFGISFQRGDGTEIAGIFRNDAANGELNIYSNGAASLFMNATGMSINGNTVWHTGNDGAGSGLDADLLDGQSSAYYADIPSRLGYTPWPSNRMGNVRVVGFGGGIPDTPYLTRDSDGVVVELYSTSQFPGWKDDIPSKFSQIRTTGDGTAFAGGEVPNGAFIYYIGQSGSTISYRYHFIQAFSAKNGWVTAFFQAS